MSKNKDSQVVVAVLEYLTKQNRPYSAIDIVNNLHKEHGKTAIVKACESLAEEGKIKEKVYGKQKVYVADQSHFPEVAESEISRMGNEISALSEDVKALQTEQRQFETELKTLSSALTTSEAIKQQASIEDECIQLNTKLDKLKHGSNSITPQQKDAIHAFRSKYVKEWRKRKRMANDMLGAILEGYPHSKKQLYEEIGVETDEDYNIKPPEMT